MTTNTDVAMPELPEPKAWRTRHKSEPGMMGHYPWTYTGRKPMRSMAGSFETENLYTAEQVRAAIQQAAVPEGAMDYALDILVAAGRIKRETAFQARDITRQFFKPALGRGDGGGVPLSDEQIDALWDKPLTTPQKLQRRFMARAIEAAHGIGAKQCS